MGFFSKIGGFFKSAGRGLFGAVKALVTSDAVKDVFKTALGQIVEQVVVEVENIPNLTSGDKRKEAIGRILSKASEQGQNVEGYLVNFLLETAVLKLKNLQGKLG